MYGMRTKTLCLVLALVGVWLAQGPTQARGDDQEHTMIHVYPERTQPQQVTVQVGSVVVWMSHLASSNLVVTTLAFHDGQRVARATTRAKGYNGFTMEGEHFVGRMEADGGMVALRFVQPGTYLYVLGHDAYRPGTIVVHK